MDLLRLNFHDAAETVGSLAASLFNQERHRVRFVHQTELAGAIRILIVLRVGEETAAAQNTVDFGHKAGNPAHVVVLAAGALLAIKQFADVLLHGLQPVTLIGAVDSEFRCFGGDADVFFREVENTGRRIKRKGRNTVTQCENELGLRAVERVTSGSLVDARLHEVSLRDVALLAARAGKNRENSADRGIDINVARAIERIEKNQVGTDSIFV